MIEVMVALFVLAIGLLGMLAMQTKSIQYNQSAYAYSQAAYLANDMVERIRRFPDRASVADYEAAAIAPSADDDFDAADVNQSCRANACSNAELIAQDKLIWATNVRNFLPGGRATIDLVNVAARDYLRVNVSFVDDKLREEDADNPIEMLQYSMLVEI